MATPEPRIRPARPEDFEALCALEAEAFGGDRLSPARMRHWLSAANGVLLVAESSGRLAGYGLMIFRRDSAAARIYSLAVAEGFRGQGIGRALMQALEKAARRRCRSELRLEVASQNADAIALYQRYGFREFGHRPNYYADGDTALRMRKPLKQRKKSKRGFQLVKE